MRSRILKSLTIIAVVTLVGVFIGTELSQATVVNAQSEAREQSFAAVQASLGAMEILRGDLHRAGYYQESTTDPGMVTISAASPLRVVTVGREILRLTSPGGSETITYRVANGQLLRSDGKAEQVLLQKVTDFRIQEVRDGKVINMSLSVGVAPEYKVAASAIHFAAHFRLGHEG